MNRQMSIRLLLLLILHMASAFLVRSLYVKSKASSVVSSLAFSTSENDVVNQRVILFDGVCNFCNTWVDLVIKLDPQKNFKFAALQSDVGKSILQLAGRASNDLSSVVYFRSSIKDTNNDSKQFFFKSDAALEVARDLDNIVLRIVYSIGVLFPRALRDGIYDIVANNRYNLLGKRNVCRLSSNVALDISDRFLS